RRRLAVWEKTRVTFDGFDERSVLQIASGYDESISGEVMVAQITEQLCARDSIERASSSGDWPAERLARPHRGVEQLVNVVLRLVAVHRDFFLDDFPFLDDVRGRELRA